MTSQQLRSVLGVIGSEQLGATLVHEHIFVLSPEIQQNLPVSLNLDLLVDHAVTRLIEAKSAGVDTVVDGTILGQGRNPELVRRVAERSPVHILAATGAFVSEELPAYFRFRAPRSADAVDILTETFVRDITEGIGPTDVRAAMLKCSCEASNPSQDVLRTIRATAQAQRETGVAVITHSEAAEQSGLLLAKELANNGVPPQQVLIGHSGDTDDLAYLRRLLDDGYFLGLDRFGYDFILPHERRVEVLVELVRLGYRDQLLLGHDSPCFIDYFQDADQATHYGDFTVVHRRVVPDLLKAGLSDQDVHRLLVDNPRRLLLPRPGPGHDYRIPSKSSSELSTVTS